ncbi:MAG: hypothetical protein CVU52_01450 [Deltaproteobacteria bacterium HGW-Deltaproteobacteria-10]|nr:MAG: hypothetical protein CVU52_01450 [Deltaproteobacteria bacterium HGW-Deltaproteobacteria-10]
MEKETDDDRMSAPRIRLTIEQWAKIESRYLFGESVTQLAKDYKISRDTIYSKAKRDKWCKHGSRKAEVEKRIAAEVEDKLVDSFKSAAQEANNVHLAAIRKSGKIVNALLDASAFMLQDRIIKLKAFEDDKMNIPDDFTLFEVARVIHAAVNDVHKLIGRNESEILGLIGKPILSDAESDHGLDRMNATFEKGAANIAGIEQLIRKEETERIKAEVRAEADAGKAETLTLQ